MSSYWLNFIKTGNPNGAGLPAWPSFRGSDNPFMVIDAAAQVRPDEDRARQAFLAQTAKRG
jgi:para-nitrobenzyl esterase